MQKYVLSLVIPCYNEEENIKPLYKQCLEAFKNMKKETELIFINDGSTDNTINELNKLLLKDDFRIKIIDFSRNFGKESAIYAGMKNSSGDFVCLIDADLQQKPELVLKMLEILKADDKYDCVCYYQDKRIENKFISFLKSKFYKLISMLSDIEFVDGASDFRLFRKYVVEAILSLPENNRFSKGIFNWIGFNTCYLPYTPESRLNGKSSFSFFGLIKYAFSGILSFSLAPLKLSTYSGVIIAFISFIYLIVVVIQKLFFTVEVPGYTTIIVLLLFLGGLILLCLGIIGEYLARVYIESKKRPIYIARKILDSKGVKNEKDNTDIKE